MLFVLLHFAHEATLGAELRNNDASDGCIEHYLFVIDLKTDNSLRKMFEFLSKAFRT